MTEPCWTVNDIRMGKRMKIFVQTMIAAFGVLLAWGCSMTKLEVPCHAKSPRMVLPPAWSARRLPGGVFQGQRPVRMGLLVAGKVLAATQNADDYLKREQQLFFEENGSWDVPHHFYVDGEGRIYKGREPEFQGRQVGDLSVEGTIGVVFLDSDLDIYVQEDAREGLIHLLTWLCFTYRIETQEIHITCAPGTESLLLCRDLHEPYLAMLVEEDLAATREAVETDPDSRLLDRVLQLRTEPKDD